MTTPAINNFVESPIQNITELFWRKGFNATSTEDLEEASSLKRASIYKQFGNKEGMFLAALRHYYQHIFEDMIATPLKVRGKGIEAIQDFFQQLQSFYRRDGGKHGCLLVNTVIELGEGQRFASEITDAFLGRMRFLILSRLKESLPEQRQQDQAQVLADGVVGNFLGLSVLCRGHADSAVVENFLEQTFIWLNLYEQAIALGIK